VVYRNQAPDSAGIGVFMGGSLVMVNCTVVGNTVDGVWAYGGGSARIINTIFWKNGDKDVPNSDNAELISTNVGIDPMFVNDFTGDFHLQANSPMIDVGNDDWGPAVDIDGEARPYGHGVDLGADEYVPAD
jgi:hypothetical protein